MKLQNVSNILKMIRAIHVTYPDLEYDHEFGENDKDGYGKINPEGDLYKMLMEPFLYYGNLNNDQCCDVVRYTASNTEVGALVRNLRPPML